MRDVNKHPLLRYLREEILPTAFCPGCGCGIVLNVFVNAIHELSINPADLIVVTGIGCSSWIPSPYLKADTLHTTHGRAVAFATGVKIMQPDKKVVVIAGDGDLIGIGGNHLIHAARRNIGLTVVLVNNFNYGMTGGQVGPTTPLGMRTTTTPYGNVEHPFDSANLVASAGADYVSRYTTLHVRRLLKSMKKALLKTGFSFVEILSQCPTSYAKLDGRKTGSEMLEEFKDSCVTMERARAMDRDLLSSETTIGEIVNRDREEFTQLLGRLNGERKKARLGESGEN